MAGILALSPIALTACGEEGVPGSVWIVDEGIPGENEGKFGDMYLDSSTNDIYQKTATGWQKVGNIGGDDGQDGEQGQPGQDGTNAYLGYDGYIWNGAERTGYRVDASLDEGVLEHTLEVAGSDMKKYFEGEYVDLTTNQIALMSNFQPNAKLTLYANSIVDQIKVYAQNAGKLYIGTAKVADVVEARTKGQALSAVTNEYSVEEGLNTITLNKKLGSDETLVLGGNGSVGLYVAKNIPNVDEDGNFTLLDQQSHAEVVCATDGKQDTLAVEVSARMYMPAAQVIDNIDFKTSLNFSFSSSTNGGPFMYANLDYFAGKHITRIDVPVKKVSAIDENQYITIGVRENTLEAIGTPAKREYKLYAPVDQLGDDKDAVNKWITFNCDIQLAENETLIFSKNGDLIWWGFNGTDHDELNFYGSTQSLSQQSLYFDVYYDKELSVAEQQEYLADLEKDAAILAEMEQMLLPQDEIDQLSQVLSGKYLSILGDSISTYKGWTNNADYNNTLSSNWPRYDGTKDGVTSVDQTWWKYTLDKTKMNLCVNNSSSGDRVSNGGQTKWAQLHDDNPGDPEINPDIIAVYFGINDFNNNSPTETFASQYEQMIDNITTKYTGAKVFLFTYVVNGTSSRPISDMEAYNNTVKSTAEKHGCEVVDLYNDSGIKKENLPYCMGDDGLLHPNPKGMELMAHCFMKALYNVYCKN